MRLSRREFLGRSWPVPAAMVLPGGLLFSHRPNHGGQSRAVAFAVESDMANITGVLGFDPPSADTYWVEGVQTDPAKFGVEDGHPYYDTVAVDGGEAAVFTGNGANPYVEFP
jgi:hypothetical protein